MKDRAAHTIYMDTYYFVNDMLKPIPFPTCLWIDRGTRQRVEPSQQTETEMALENFLDKL